MNRFEVRKWLLKPGITGFRAIFWAMVAVAVPTLVRLAFDGVVTGTVVAIYVPSVLLSAIFLDWKYAAGMALAAAIIIDAFFIGPGPQLLEGPSEIFAMAVFLIAAAMIIGFVHAVRNLVGSRRIPGKQPSGIVFSEESGEAWAGWHGRSSRVPLGPQDEVAEMMEDFLAHRELAEHLSRKSRKPALKISGDA
ncbi:MAG TPA: DUF4118 domain-containing protein [Sphingomicrobium sp.]|nr:DUF4118 domain-containing protein [Sphingomicrobium sp.]